MSPTHSRGRLTPEAKPPRKLNRDWQPARMEKPLVAMRGMTAVGKGPRKDQRKRYV